MPHPLGVVPSKIFAVHLSYRSRALERGRLPEHPSYFLKPPSTLAVSGDPVVRPYGCDLLAFEGEIALVVGTRARGVSPEDGWDHVASVTAANDFGVYDLRYADGGSNARSKGIDGYTPVGPRLIDARAIDPSALRVRTWVNGELAQSAVVADELLFGFGLMVADISRLTTLEPGDLILTGTPTGSSVVQPGDVVEVEVDAGAISTGRLVSRIIAADAPLAPIGAMPRQDDGARTLAYGSRRPPAVREAPPRFSEQILAGLRTVSTATLASQLRKRGLNGFTMEGLHTTRPNARLLGTARTLRYLPLREDLFAERGSGMNAQKRGIDEIEPGEVLVIDARQDPGAGTIGDILALRAQVRGATGIVTDGGLRDSVAVAALDIPTYYRSVHPAVLGRRHVPWEVNVAVACAGVLVQPGDLLVGDADGVVLVPDDLVSELVTDGLQQESEERFITERVAAAESVDGLYPLGARWRTQYERWLSERQETGHEVS